MSSPCRARSARDPVRCRHPESRSARGTPGTRRGLYSCDLGAWYRHHGQMGNTGQLALIRRLADAVARVSDADDRRLVMDELAVLSGAGWLRLDELARRPYWGMSPLDEIAGWARFAVPGAAAVEVIAAAMCRDGRIREAAVSRLAAVPGPAAASAVAVRVGDWVPEVRSAALAALQKRDDLADAAAVVPVLLARVSGLS